MAAATARKATALATWPIVLNSASTCERPTTPRAKRRDDHAAREPQFECRECDRDDEQQAARSNRVGARLA
jgi:hypothetical protein